MKVVVPHPADAEEMRSSGGWPVAPPDAEQVLTLDELVTLQSAADEVFVHHAIAEYAVALVMATREPATWRAAGARPAARVGASPARRASASSAAGRALAVLRGRDYVVPGDIADLAVDVLAHRLVLSYEALADGVTAEDVIARDPGHRAAAGRRARPSTMLPADPRRERAPRCPRMSPRRRSAARGSTSRAGSTACCRATTTADARTRAASRPRPGATSPVTTPGGSTGR